MAMIHSNSGNAFSSISNVQPQDIQPNAIDLRLKKVFDIQSNVFTIDEETKAHRGSQELQPDHDGYFNLPIGSYEVVMENEINVAEGEAGWVVTRSTLNRNGVHITSGLYDSGYNGVIAGVLHVNVAPMRVKVGTRIAQFLLFEAESLHKYNGDYGKDKIHDEKYAQ